MQSLLKMLQFDIHIANIFVNEIINILHNLTCDEYEAAWGWTPSSESFKLSWVTLNQYQQYWVPVWSKLPCRNLSKRTKNASASWNRLRSLASNQLNSTRDGCSCLARSSFMPSTGLVKNILVFWILISIKKIQNGRLCAEGKGGGNGGEIKIKKLQVAISRQKKMA